MKATISSIFTSINFTDCSAAGLDAEDCPCQQACAGDRRRGRRAGPAGRRVAGLLLDPGVPVRALAPTQDHRAEQPRQPGAEVAARDLREIADVESWGAGNNRAASTTTASGFPDSDAPLEGSGRGVVSARGTGCRCRRTAARPPPRYRPACHPSRARPLCAGVEPGIRRGAGERAQVEVRPGQPPPALSATAGQTAAIASSPARRARASSTASPAMRPGTAATRARPAATSAVPGQPPPGRRFTAGVEPGEPARGLPQSAHLVTETVRDQVPPV